MRIEEKRMRERERERQKKNNFSFFPAATQQNIIEREQQTIAIPLSLSKFIIEAIVHIITSSTIVLS